MPGKLTLAEMRALAKELARDEAQAKADREQRLRAEKFGSAQQEEAMLKGREKDAGLER